MKTINALQIEFYLNDRHVKLAVTPSLTALTCIREQLGLTGAKEVCAEGDCGACTIALGSLENDKIVYSAINSCILPAAKLHGKHILTVEGLSSEQQLHPLQQAMVELHAIQCGYCTSGFVMSLFCLFANNPQPNEKEIFAALEGNLCRCTGYLPMLKVARSFYNSLKNNEKLFTCFIPEYTNSIKEKLIGIAPYQTQQISNSDCEVCSDYSIPNTLVEMFGLMERANGKFKIINGGTDLMVAANIHEVLPQQFIDISRIQELNFINEADGKIHIGGNVTFKQLLNSTLVAAKIPSLQYTLSRMSSEQVRNVSTLAGNIANASPIGDTTCLLLALGAELVLLSQQGERKIPIENFCCDYKVTSLNSKTEIISRIEIPAQLTFCDFEKTTKRRVLDISTVNSAINLALDTGGTIKQCRIAFGGVAKFSILASQTAAFLIGKKLSQEVILAAAAIAMEEFQPISDVRGTAEYRRQLIHNHIIKSLTKLMH